MADALISPAVGGTMWALSGGLLAYCARAVHRSRQDHLIPLMGVMGAFVFAAQMINFSIPFTGSSGHLGGGLLLAILLGPHAAFLVIASVLTVQAFFFLDGGLLALGCNVFNLGFFPAFVAYPLFYRNLATGHCGTRQAWMAAIIAAAVGLQLGALAVVLQTQASGISDLPFGAFVLLMLPIHLAIGVVEGVATAVVVSFVARARAEVLPTAPAPGAAGSRRPVLIGLALAAVVAGGVASWFASTRPDGLEWAVFNAGGSEAHERPGRQLHRTLAAWQEHTSFLPDYSFKAPERASDPANETGPEPWPAIRAGTSVSGLLGGLLTLALVWLTGAAIRMHGLPCRRKTVTIK